MRFIMEDIQTQKHGNVLHIQLNRPAKKNSITTTMYHTWYMELKEAAENDEIHTVVMTGNDECFSSGNDLRTFANPDGRHLTPIPLLLEMIALYPKPIIAGVAGPCIGIGSTILLHCDYVVAHRSAFFSMPFVKLGLVPEAGASLMMPKRAGTLIAKEWLMWAKKYTADQALTMRIVNEIIDEPVVQYTLNKAINEFSKLPIEALTETKRLIQHHIRDDLKSAIQIECETFFDRLKSKEAQQAIQAFFDAKT